MEQKSTYKLHYAEPYWSIMLIVIAGWFAMLFMFLFVVDAAVDAREEVGTYKAAMIKAEENYQAALDADVELKNCRDGMATVMFMANGEAE